MASSVVRIEKQGDVALLVIDSPPVNALSQPVVDGLAGALAAANSDPAVRALVVCGAGENFIAGADIAELGRASGPESGKALAPNLTKVLEDIDGNAKPVVMAIDGFALGGGLEVAMSGHWRVGTTRCRVGLPELTLGIIPGAGGTQRLPRLIGVAKATEMMLTSAEARATEALSLGIVQELVEPAQLREAAVAAARKLADDQAARVRASQDSSRLGTPAEVRAAVQGALAKLGDKARNQIHHVLCADAIEHGAVAGYAAGLAREAENFARCLQSSQARGMIHLFFAQRTASKVPGVTDQKFAAREFRRAAVLGGGTMGSGIATALLQGGLEVTLKEVDATAAAAGRGRIEGNLQSRLKKGSLSQAKYDELLGRLKLQTDYAGFDQMDLVIEAVVENIELKQQVFADLEKACRADAILASNTSTIDLEVIGTRTQAAARILGTHFFSPAHVMPLVEVVRSRQTSPEVLNSVIQLAKRIKKTPVTVGNCVGFLVNRIFFPYGQSAGLLVDCGLDPYRVDQALYDFGMPMGPFRMADLAGVDVGKFAGDILARAYPDRAYASTLGDQLFAAKRFGQKTGRGYYRYPDAKKAEADPELAPFLERARADAGRPAALRLGDAEIVERVLLPVVNEACRCLQEGIAIRASDIDVASVMGMGFPQYRGGLMHWAETLGAGAIVERLSAWERTHGSLYTPCEFLQARAQCGEKLA